MEASWKDCWAERVWERRKEKQKTIMSILHVLTVWVKTNSESFVVISARGKVPRNFSIVWLSSMHALFVCFLCIQQSIGRSKQAPSSCSLYVCVLCFRHVWPLCCTFASMYPFYIDILYSVHAYMCCVCCVTVKWSHPVSHVCERRTQGGLFQNDPPGTGKHPPQRASHTRPSRPVSTT